MSIVISDPQPMKIIDQWIVNDYGKKRLLVLTANDGYFMDSCNGYFQIDTKRLKELLENEVRIIEDGFGNSCSSVCPNCNKESMQIVRPGKFQCKYCG